jgi:hypothetical protein
MIGDSIFGERCKWKGNQEGSLMFGNWIGRNAGHLLSYIYKSIYPERKYKINNKIKKKKYFGVAGQTQFFFGGGRPPKSVFIFYLLYFF